MRVVLDTNVLISAFLFDKQIGKVLELVDDGSITPCECSDRYSEDIFRKNKVIIQYHD